MVVVTCGRHVFVLPIICVWQSNDVGARAKRKGGGGGGGVAAAEIHRIKIIEQQRNCIKDTAMHSRELQSEQCQVE